MAVVRRGRRRRPTREMADWNGGGFENANEGTLKLIFWLLAAMFAVMTSIGGFSAMHLITEVDDIHAELNNVKVQVESDAVGEKFFRDDVILRIERIEKKVDK